MNIKICSIENGRDSKDFKQRLPQLMTELNRRNMHVMYAEQVEAAPEELLKAIMSSNSAEDRIDAVILLNAYGSSNNGDIQNLLCQLCGASYTPAKKLAEEYGEIATGGNDISLKEERVSGEDFANAFSLGDMGKGYEAYCFFLGDLRIIALPSSSVTGTEELKMIREALEGAALRAPLPRDAVNDMGVRYNIQPLDTDSKKKKKKKRGFIKSVIPMKGDRPAEIIRKLILIAASLTFVITAGFLINYLVVQPTINDNMNNEIRQIASKGMPSRTTTSSNDKDKDDKDDRPKSSRNFEELQKINKELVAWVQIPDTMIDYPVMMHKGDDINNQYYLYRDMYKNYSGYGSIFIDWRSKGGVNAKNIILHGHHMQDGRMFQNLMGYGKYTGDLDFYKKHPLIYFDTPNGDCDWKIIAYYKTNTLDAHGDYFDYLTGEFNSDAEFMNYVYLIRERSLIDCPVDVNEDDQLISLSTCSYEFSEFRTVLVARKCRPGESSDVDVKKAQLNSDPLWPDVYYNNYGGQKPKITSFSKAYKAGDIDWYDGHGNLKGKERNFTLHDAADAAAAQDDDSSSTSSEQKIKEKGISFNMDKMSLENGLSSRLTVIWNPDNVADKTIKWTTSNVGVADIDGDGMVYAMGPGKATITAESKYGYKATCEVTVIQPVSSLYLNYTGYDFYEKTSVQLSASVTPSNATDKTLTWSSDNPAVATVDQKGLVYGVAVGQTVIRVRTSNGLEMACNVNVMPVN